MKELLLLFTGKMRCHPPCADAIRQFNKRVAAALLLLLISASTFAQSNQITGRVTDATGQSLPGVTVRIKGGTAGTITGGDGKYSIAAASDATLVFSFVGYTAQEIRVSAQKVIDVQLRDDARALNEVVVIGYQTVRKKDLTGAISTVSPAEANKVTSNSLGNSLQGLSPGLTVRTTGDPNSAAEVEIRGIGSFISTSPLYVIDGMITEGGNNVTLNNNDIESIQVLKDASAAAIYGSRAANGVIIVTTKQGKKGAPKISFSAKFGAQQIPKKWDMMNSAQYAATKSQEYTNSGLAVPPSVGSAFNSAVNTNWQDLDERTGNDQDYNVTISGASDNSKYLISGSYYDNQGVLKAYSLNRSSLRINTETKKGRLTFGENALMTYTNSYHPNRGNPFYDLPQLLPTVPVKDPSFIDMTSSFTGMGYRNPQGYSNGTIDNQDVTYAYNTLAVNDLSKGYSNFSKIIGNAFAQLRLFDWLDYKFNVGLETSFDYNRDLRKDGTFSYAAQQELSYIDEDRERYTNLLLEHTLNFNKSFGVHNINGVVGFTQQSVLRTFTDARRTNLQTVNGEYLTSINSASGNPSANGGTSEDYKIHSFLGRVNYSYNDKYLLTATGRIDQDSRFGPDYRSGFFPSVAAAWRISKENFFKVNWINDLKLNASYGVLGINTVGAFANQGFINNAPRAVFGSDVVQNGAYQAALYNADVRWESRYETNIGLDAALLNNKISVSLAVYNNLSKNALVQEPEPSYLGSNNSPYVNAASIRNRGIEFAATYRNFDHQLKWSIGGNLTTIKNKVISVGNQAGANYLEQGGITRSQIGNPIGQWFVLKDVGIFQSQADVNNYKRANGDLIEPFAKPGDIKFYANPNGTGTLNNNDRVFDGSALPTLQTGLQFNASYKQFSMNLQLVGIFGVTLYNDVRRVLDSYQNTNFRTDINPWTTSNTNTSDPRLGIANGDAGIANNNTPSSSRWLENGSYGRIRNLEFGYELPKSVAQRWHMDNIRVFVSGQNLLTVTPYKGLDPDVPGNLLQPGYDAGTWPASRVFSIGLNCGF